MSRSYRKNYVLPMCCISGSVMKEWRTRYNRVYRRKNKQILHVIRKDPDYDYMFDDVYKTAEADYWLSPADGFQTVKKLTESEFYARDYSWWFEKTNGDYQDYLGDFKRIFICK